MLPILTVSGISFLIGCALAQLQGALPVRPGLVGLAVMLLGAFSVRRHWQPLHADSGPGSPERELWHCLSTTLLIAGHLAMSLWITGPSMALHSLAVHSMAVDSWTLVLGAWLSFRIARDPDPRRDERDNLFGARAIRVAYITLTVGLCVVSVFLAFGADIGLPTLSQPLIAHILIGSLMSAAAVRCGAQLAMYDRDRRETQESA